MPDISMLLQSIKEGDPQAAKALLPLVYDELRKLARKRLARESPGQTLDATALVHEAYVRMVGAGDDRQYNDQGHFFAVAAEAMRHILVDKAYEATGNNEKAEEWRKEAAAVAGEKPARP
jgi:RNA polymerase sigma factor (TIGR02999 family)